MKKLISALFFCVLLVGCAHSIYSEAGFVRPMKDYKFAYAKKVAHLKNCDMIDTTVIYYLHDSYFYRGNTDYKHSDAFIRFYADGHFKTIGLKATPTVDDVNNMEKGVVGYYLLQGNKVMMQMYTGEGSKGIKLELGYIDNDKSLVVINKSISESSTHQEMKELTKTLDENPKIYKKTNVKGMTYIHPVW